MCLPKSGSTSLTQWLEASGRPARHECNTLAVLQLAALRRRPDYPLRRRLWLQARAVELAGACDVNTALYAVLLPSDQPSWSSEGLAASGVEPQWLCRSLRPWLLSSISWSLRFGADPHRRRWLQLHRGFVEACSTELAATMPADPASTEALLRFWLPVWLAFVQQALDVSQALGRPYRLTDQLPPQHHANASAMAPELRRRLEALLPQLPALQGDAAADRDCLAQCRRWWAQLACSSG